jgi:TonB family protein
VLELARGSVTNHVRKLVGAEGYEVLADAHRIAVRGTRFSVERMAPGLAVQVDEGVVAVLDNDGNLITELKAPYRWTEGLGGLASAPRAYGERLREPREAGAGHARWPSLEVPSWPHIVNWEIDGSAFEAGGTLRMRVPTGDLDILATLDDGRRIGGRLRVDALGAKFDPRALRWPNPKPLSDAAAGVPKLGSGGAASVIHDDQAALQRCYERAMRGQTNGSSALRVRLRLDLDAEGRVKRVALTTQDEKTAPPMLDECVRQVAQRWRFEAPGGRGVTFEAPLSFRPAQ